ncbi:hypothetical protein QBC39DRAFT_361989 [Podospora conica]|nr:hypothetical protein QBC39DRAFT_361989 [Schizothecium conicum]
MTGTATFRALCLFESLVLRFFLRWVVEVEGDVWLPMGGVGGGGHCGGGRFVEVEGMVWLPTGGVGEGGRGRGGRIVCTGGDVGVGGRRSTRWRSRGRGGAWKGSGGCTDYAPMLERRQEQKKAGMVGEMVVVMSIDGQVKRRATRC